MRSALVSRHMMSLCAGMADYLALTFRVVVANIEPPEAQAA